jgi:hypothetical protein
MKLRSSTFLTAMTAMLLLGSGYAWATDIPGTVPAGAKPSQSQALRLQKLQRAEAQGLKVFYDKFGLYRVSVGAAGSNGGPHSITLKKPAANAVVDKAYLMAASNWYAGINDGDITLDGHSISWSAAVSNLGGFFDSVRADVTELVRTKLNNAAAGNVTFNLAEVNNDAYIDGEILAVVFKVPSATQKRDIVLMFGGQRLEGDRFEVTLGSPLDPALRSARADMGLGISYGYQGYSQYSNIAVNGAPLSASAGGQDDGAAENGALITVGGVGDSNANPANPTATPNGDPRMDDELYSLKPFVKKSDHRILVETSNPSIDDNIFFGWFDLSVAADVDKDTDGDGLLDSWEKYGYDKDGDDVIDVNLPRMGANYKKKDIFVGYVWMEKSATETKSHKPSSDVLEAIRNAFAIAPVSNPDGTNGIKIHFVNKGSVPHDNDLNPVWTEFDALVNPKFTDAEKDIYHRLLNGHMYSGGTSSGLSRDIPASDFIETLGGWGSNPGTYMQRAGTIMHELGHNLGLRHGGVDHENYKPNHLSIMSYANQVVWLLKNGVAKLDYERFNLNALNETSLSEAAGLNRVGGDTPISHYGVRWYVPAAKVKTTGANKNVDWNNSGAINGAAVAVDVNNSGGQSTLNANYPEWPNIVYKGGEIGEGVSSDRAPERTSAHDLDELTYEQYLKQMATPQSVK